MNLIILLHDFSKLQPPKLYKNVQELFCQVVKLFSAEIWKMTERHFLVDLMLRQPHVRASPAQKLRGLRVVLFQNFSRATFFFAWVSHLVDISLCYFPVKQI